MPARMTIRVEMSVMCPQASVRHQNRRYSCSSEELTFYVVDVGHYLENTGNTTLHFLEIFDTGGYPYSLSSIFEGRSRYGMSQTVSRI